MNWVKYPKLSDFLFNQKQFIRHQFFFTIFDRLRYMGGVQPDYGNYFLRIQAVRTTIVAKSRRLEAKWTVMDE